MSNDTPSKRRNRGHDLKAINWVRDDVRGLSLYERVLMQYLASKCNTDGTHSCFPEQRTIAADLEIDRRTVIRYLKSLEDRGLISKKRRPNTSAKYTLHVSGSDSQMSFPEVTGNDTSGSDSQIHQKEGTISKESEVKNLEPLSEGTAPSASAGEQTPVLPETPETKTEVITQNFTASGCRDDPTRTGLRFYMDCGRLNTRADHFHRPKKPKKPLTVPQLESLRMWFKALSESGCAVMNHAMENWPRLREEHRVGQTTPTISALEKAGHKGLLDSWKASQQNAMLNRVESIQLLEKAP